MFKTTTAYKNSAYSVLFRLKRRSRRYLLDPDLLREWAAGAEGCEAYRGATADHQLLIDAIEQEVEFDDQVETVVCIDDDSTKRLASPGSEAAAKNKEDERMGSSQQQKKSKIVDRYILQAFWGEEGASTQKHIGLKSRTQGF